MARFLLHDLAMKNISFDEVFQIWINNEIGQVENRDVLPVAKAKGFGSVAEWRLNTALRLGLDKLNWQLEEIENPGEVLPNVIVGPYRGWSFQKGITFFENNLNTSFAQALEIPEFFEFCNHHDRVVPLSEKFPLPTTIILARKPDGSLIHIEGGHRICAVAYAKKIGKPIEFAGKPPVYAAITDVTEEDIARFIEKAREGTEKQSQ